jgi:hypothetical protein
MICSGPPAAKALAAERLMCDVSHFDRQLSASLLPPFNIGAAKPSQGPSIGKNAVLVLYYMYRQAVPLVLAIDHFSLDDTLQEQWPQAMLTAP